MAEYKLRRPGSHKPNSHNNPTVQKESKLFYDRKKKETIIVAYLFITASYPLGRR